MADATLFGVGVILSIPLGALLLWGICGFSLPYYLWFLTFLLGETIGLALGLILLLVFSAWEHAKDKEILK